LGELVPVSSATAFAPLQPAKVAVRLKLRNKATALEFIDLRDILLNHYKHYHSQQKVKIRKRSTVNYDDYLARI
jgi:hypothetical protein